MKFSRVVLVVAVVLVKSASCIPLILTARAEKRLWQPCLSVSPRGELSLIAKGAGLYEARLEA